MQKKQYTYGIWASQVSGNRGEQVYEVAADGNWRRPVASFRRGRASMTVNYRNNDEGFVVSMSEEQSFSISNKQQTNDKSVYHVKAADATEIGLGYMFGWFANDNEDELIAFNLVRKEQDLIMLYTRENEPALTPLDFFTITVSIVGLLPNDWMPALEPERPRTVAIRNKKDPNFCLDNPWGSTGPTYPNHVWECNGSPPQKWTFFAGQLKNANGLCLDVYDNKIEAGTSVGTYHCDQRKLNQDWTYSSEDQTLRTQADLFNLCLDVQGGSIEYGASLVISKCDDDSLSQKWDLVEGQY